MEKDTQMGGTADRFPLTSVSVLEAIRGGDAAGRDRAMQALIAAYWKPVYKYIRMKREASNEEAKDLTQGFFVQALERGFIEGYAAERSAFRTYLRMCVDGYVVNERKAASRQKRGGGRSLLSLDFDAADSECTKVSVSVGDESFFDRECLRSLLERAAIRFHGVCENSGKTTHFLLFERYDLRDGASGASSYDDLAREFGLPVTQVTNYLAWARRTFRQCALETLRELTGSEAEFRDEARRLLGVAV